MHVVRKTEAEAAGDALTHQHHQREWRQGTGQEGGGGEAGDWEGDARQTCRAPYWVRLQI